MVSKTFPEEKVLLHPRNKHKYRYDFPRLIASLPELSQYVFVNQYDNLSIDFKIPEAVKTLNKALLKYFYNITNWDIPKGYLCPPIPGRADYIHYLADLLTQDEAQIPALKQVKILDIGVGANCIYPLIGLREYGWNFVGSDIDSLAIRNAKSIVKANGLSDFINIRKQNSKAAIFTGLINLDERFDFTMCNPPFHASLEEASTGTERKRKNLGQTHDPGKTLNFGGQNAELWTEGGERKFISQMIKESSAFSTSVCWFTTLVSKKDTLPASYSALKKEKVIEVKTIDMAQGQKISRILAWTFLTEAERKDWKTNTSA